jgi:hypothetical protein
MKPSHQHSVQVLTRGMAVKGVDSALSSPKTDDGAPLRWSQDSIVVSTFPNPMNHGQTIPASLTRDFCVTSSSLGTRTTTNPINKHEQVLCKH